MSARRGRDVPSLVEGARAGDPRAVARLITLVEDADPALPEIAAALAPYTGTARVIGLTGAPGVGKSTTTNELVRGLRARDQRVGVLAVDPSSPYTGGAILGDRVRMQDHAMDPGVYIRSMSSRGHLGGLATATPQAVRVLEGAGCDWVLVETVGVGQAEVEVASLADTTLVLLAPGMGDAIQAVKAGILEIADVFVINKADRDGADATYHDIQGMIGLADRAPGQWRPQVIRAVAARASRRRTSSPRSSSQPWCLSIAVRMSSMPSARAATARTTCGRHCPGARSPNAIMPWMSWYVASAPSRSALLITKTSAISRMPALTAWIASPIPGASSTSVVSASEATSTSACPTPTVSTSTQSQPAPSSTRTACGVAADRPPRWPRLDIDRM